MSGLQLNEEELWPTSLPGWQTGDSQYTEDQLLQMSVTMCSIPSSSRRSSLWMSRTTSAVLFSGDAYDDDEEEGCWSLLSMYRQKSLKNQTTTEPKMPEELSYIVLHQVLYPISIVQDVSPNSITKPRAHLPVQRRTQEG